MQQCGGRRRQNAFGIPAAEVHDICDRRRRQQKFRGYAPEEQVCKLVLTIAF